jgi:Ca-activated chloride channel family protein
VELVQTYPSRLPDVFFGEELVIFGRYHGAGDGEIVVSGQRGGRTERFTAQAVFPAGATENAFIPRLWASRRIGELTRQIRIEGATPNLVQEVRELGLRYGILTEYTAYLVQEPVTTNAQLMRPRDVMPNQGSGGAPAAPSAQTGAAAFRSARSSSAMMGAGSLAAADAAADARMGELGGVRGVARNDVQRVHGRLFVRIGSVWTDAAHQDSLRVIEVAPFSEAYFQLVRVLPEVAPYLRLGDEVLVAGRRASIKVTASGTTTWRTGQMDAVVRAFRGA